MLIKNRIFLIGPMVFFAVAGGQELLNRVDINYQYYQDNNGVWVHEPMLAVTQKIQKTSAISMHYLVDAVTGASRKVNAPSLTVDAVTGASTRETRKEFGAGFVRQWENAQIGLSFSKSDENDYHSLSGALDARHDLFDKNTNLTVNFTRFNDDYSPLENNNGLGGKKQTNSLTLGWTQTLSRRTLGMISWGVTAIRGFTGRAYYHVLAEETAAGAVPPAPGGTFYLEAYPGERFSRAWVARVRQQFPSIIKTGAVQVEYRRYDDDWGIGSHTVEALLNQYLHQNIFVQLRGRYYLQTAASFYRDRYTAANVNRDDPDYLAYRTVDPKFSGFHSLAYSLKLVCLARDFLKPETHGVPAFFPAQLDLEIERYLRSTHPDGEVRFRRYESYDENGLKAWLFRAGIVFFY